MSTDYILHGPKKPDIILFKSFGQYLFDCLRKRNFNDIVARNALENEELTCGTLLERSVKLSRVFQQFSIERTDVIALLCENTVKNFTPVLASLFLGVPIHCINFAYTLDELRHTLKISQAKFVICPKVALEKILILKDELNCIERVILIDGGSEDEIKNIDDLIDGVVVDVEHFQVSEVNLEDTAFLYMSSGSTGLPKCVELTHRNLNYSTKFSTGKDYINISNKDVTVSAIPFFHIYGQIINISAITGSLNVVLLSAFKPTSFLKAISTYKATKLFLVPTLLHFLCTYRYIQDYDISSITEIFVGGSYLSEKVYQLALERLSNVSIRQMYGATELTGGCIMQKSSTKVHTIGSLVENNICKIIDVETKEVCGPGRPGEICISGNGVAKGYYRNPVETENAFASDNFYRTGDVGYYNNEGLFFIVGRVKELIKYKGFQVAPAELESLILTHPAVQDCAVVGISDEAAGELPMACVVPKYEVTEDEIVRYVAERISPQKRLHGGVKFVETIPKSELGKLLRNKVNQMYGNGTV